RNVPRTIIVTANRWKLDPENTHRGFRVPVERSLLRLVRCGGRRAQQAALYGFALRREASAASCALQGASWRTASAASCALRGPHAGRRRAIAVRRGPVASWART